MNYRTDVLIVGGGIIGVACAAELAQRGIAVTVIDKGEIGHGCSYGNAGWITPSFAMPLPMPGMLMKSARWLLSPDSPLYIKPRCSLELMRWLLRFFASTTTRKMIRSTQALVELAEYSREAYERLHHTTDGTFDFQPRGTLVISSSAACHKDAMDHLELVSQFGVQGCSMSAAEVRQFEPAIALAEIEGGVFYPNDAHAEPLATVVALQKHAEAAGATIIANTEASEFLSSNNRITGIRTTRDVIVADRVVLTAGAWSRQLGKMLGEHIPMMSGKGYAVITEPPRITPTRPIEWLDKRTVFTPHAQRLRMAGTLELVDLDESITMRRVDNIIRAGRELLNFGDAPVVVETWAGLRPCTPDGVPIIAPSKRWRNLFIAAGHQMLGLMTAPATACLLADLVTDTTPRFDPHPFRASRF